VCPESDNQFIENRGLTSLRACLVDGDADQLQRARRTRRRSLLLSVLLQIGVLAVLVLIPILAKTERIALANAMPLPPYYHTTSSEHATERPHRATRTHQFSFCTTCSRVVGHLQPRSSGRRDDSLVALNSIGGPGPECPECAGLIGKNTVQPLVPPDPTPSIVRVAHLDPAMLIHRVEPLFPTLARQAGREGRVELHALIGADGAVRSLQALEGDPMFYPSALDAVRQWRYKPTFLNGRPVEVDTHISVIYKLNR
jgi:TonB family protein